MSPIAESSIITLLQLRDLVKQLTPSEYREALTVLKQNSLGKHVRHIVEVYQALFSNSHAVDYENRPRNITLELDQTAVDEVIAGLLQQIREVGDNKTVLVNINQSIDSVITVVESSLFRELTYCQDHAIHHMAMIAIGIRQELNTVSLPPTFGMAYSTIKYSETCVQ